MNAKNKFDSSCEKSALSNDLLRVLAIDPGEKRVGLAISIPGLKISQPLKTVARIHLWGELGKIFEAYEIGTVVVGLPLRTDGTSGKEAELAEALAKEVSRRFKVEVELWDERFSTKSAEEALRLLGKKPSRHKESVDTIAATLILDEYLSSS